MAIDSYLVRIHKGQFFTGIGKTGPGRIVMRATDLSCFSSRSGLRNRVTSSSSRPDLPVAAGLASAGG